jgi:hypothetical protein
MWTGTVDTDYNGIVLFDPGLLRDRYGGAIAEGTDLFTRYTTTEEGDEVIAAGLVVPILAIDDAGYEVAVRTTGEPSPIDADTVVENGVYPLRVRDGLVIADLAVLREWVDELGWQPVGMAPGSYAVRVRGFRAIDGTGRRIERAGFEFVLDPCEVLPRPSADLGRNMRVLHWKPSP